MPYSGPRAAANRGKQGGMDHSPGFLRLCDEAKSRIEEVSIDDVAKRLARGDRFELVDVREDNEVAKGKIKGARHIGRGVLERDIEKVLPNPDTDIVLYCGGGFRSALSAESLKKMGYRRVSSMAGGFRGWQERDLPTE
jgi:rhodanese-related sulfurtransferase